MTHNEPDAPPRDKFPRKGPPPIRPREHESNEPKEAKDETPPRLPPPPKRHARWVDTEAQLEDVARKVFTLPQVSLDSEGSSLHTYRDRICIVQLTLPDEDIIIDVDALEHLAPLAAALDRDDVEIVMHGGDYDVSMLRRDHGIPFHRIFDTMIAASVLAEKGVGLAALVDRHFGVVLDKKFQKANWTERPVDPSARLYLQRDTIYLPALRNHYGQALADADLTEEADIEFARVALRINEVQVFNPDGWRRTKGIQDLGDKGRCAMHALHAWREGAAERRNRPSFKVCPPQVLVSVARHFDRVSIQQAVRQGTSERQRGRWRKPMERALDEADRAFHAGDIPPKKLDTPPTPDQRKSRKTWQAFEKRFRDWRRKEAEARSVPPLVVLPNPGMRWLFEHEPHKLQDLEACTDVGPKRIERYGDTYLALVKGDLPKVEERAP